jgi:hypothetical protein
MGVLGPLEVRRGTSLIDIAGAKPRAVLTMLGLHVGEVVSEEGLVERRAFGEGPRNCRIRTEEEPNSRVGSKHTRR